MDLLRVGLERQNSALARPPGDAMQLAGWAIALDEVIAQNQRIWDYFRGKLEQRFSRPFAEPLWLADTIAYDCHRPVIGQATQQRLLDVDQQREPPLTYLHASGGPATLKRGDHPNNGRSYDLGNATLPFPVISLPRESITNIWELIAIAHEVGHDLEADLNARGAMQTGLEAGLLAAGCPADRRAHWCRWQGEILADVLALMLVGPAFLDALIHLLLLPEEHVVRIDAAGRHPPPYLRIILGLEYARRLTAPQPAPQDLTDHIDRLDARWRSLYPSSHPKIAGWFPDITHVLNAITDTPISPGGPTWRTLVTYTTKDDGTVRGAVGYLATGKIKPHRMRPRHVIAAARIAAEEAARNPATLPAALEAIHGRAARLVREFAPPGFRGVKSSDRHRQFIQSFYDKVNL